MKHWYVRDTQSCNASAERGEYQAVEADAVGEDGEGGARDEREQRGHEAEERDLVRADAAVVQEHAH